MNKELSQHGEGLLMKGVGWKISFRYDGRLVKSTPLRRRY